MTRIPKKLFNELMADPFYKKCAREGLFEHECAGRITFEHALIFAGKQIQKRFAILPICAKGHSVDSYQDGGDLDKQIHVWIALNRATSDELIEISKSIDYLHLRQFLNEKYGVYKSLEEPVIQF